MADCQTRSQFSEDSADSDRSREQSRLERRLAQHTSTQITVIEKPPKQKGCAGIPMRWAAERSIALAGRKRAASHEYNRASGSSEAFICFGSATMALNRLYPRNENVANLHRNA